MTQNRELKRRIRLRMRETGETYMQARSQLVPATPASHKDRSTPDMSTSDSVVPPPAPAWTPRAQVLLRGAESQAIRWRHQHVGTEHLLLALMEDTHGVAGQLLEKAGISEQLKREVVSLLSSEAYYTSSVMDLDEDGNPIVDPVTGQVQQHAVPPQNP